MEEAGGRLMYRVKNRTKYNVGSRETREHNGVYYDSKLEAGYAAKLDILVNGGAIKSWRRQVTVPLTAYGKQICTYRVDFEITHNDGHIEFVEVKGFETPVWRIKWKLFEAMMNAERPDIELTVVR